MSYDSSIEWTEATWNPTTGCSPVSAGCTNCYARRLALRLQAMGNPNYADGFRLTLHEHMLGVPLSWRKPRMVFVNSMSDLFHTHVPFSFTDSVFETMRACPRHIFQLLTKRSAKLLAYARRLERWPENVWAGVTVEDARVKSRIADLRAVPAAVRFLSCEPLIADVGSLPLDGIHWVIVGGESGPGAREMKESWVQSIRRQCEDAGVAFFFKQWGGVRKDLTGRELNGQVYDELPELHPGLVAAESLLVGDAPRPGAQR
ncbi:MAG TPA: phage Gp37/Gp68 family protein [candidate division WOR-3 bacterium]|uniref:Phage Gp37/Gp68 family protein n=1 Tax=candidate division WOR-3 bacterium TaxID=2052148 RepID=A0A7V0T4E7_UNCW3|nr:phage Gp37/Gp68 family protein [candidate division WOR-3 bacterium]